MLAAILEKTGKPDVLSRQKQVSLGISCKITVFLVYTESSLIFDANVCHTDPIDVSSNTRQVFLCAEAY